MTFTYAQHYEAASGWYVGQLLEIPGVLSQGRTAEELRENLLDALHLYLEVVRDQTTDNLTAEGEPFERLALTA